jgi:isoamylase
VQRDGINFSIVSRHATSVTLLVYAPGEDNPILEFLIDPRLGRTGEVWHCFVRSLDPGVHYAYRMDCVPNPETRMHRFNPTRVLLDPYARAIVRAPAQRVPESAQSWRRGLVANSVFDWGADHRLSLNPADAVIYELHVRGFTRHPSSGVSRPGTFAGLVEKIPYLKELGVNVVELMPVWEFEEGETDRFDPATGKALVNFWGYHPVSFFVPQASYTSASGDGAPIREFKEMVKSLHAAGIAVILDIVFNHTAEGDERGVTHSFRGIDNAVYYMLEAETGSYLNYSGCGNTLNCNHPRVRNLIIDVLQYWVTEMHVDGFRFDLASVLGRGTDGEVLANPPIVEAIAENPS